ncbi:MAG: class I tRNA ligase family protein, partial [Saprospiraceae bacterium]|nr:class I tRNA ligase family protein [Saprospiraceae bacterium]
WSPDYKDAIFDFVGGSYHQGNLSLNDPSAPLKFITNSEVGKMSKSKYNVINPDDVIEKYGTDCFRMYEMFLGPLENSKPWDTKGIDGVYKFIKKLWRLFFTETGKLQISEEKPTNDELKVLHQTIKKVQDDIERYSFNTCISHFMVAVNEMRNFKQQKREILEPLVILLAPFAPHLSEELWHQLGHTESVHLSQFPKFDASRLVDSEITYPISINGKRRGEESFSADATPKEIEEKALNLEIVKKWTEGKTVRKVIVVPKRMVNIVVG